jgi:hypothetical protein
VADQPKKTRQELFATLADQFIARVRAANVGPATEVWLTYHCVDQAGTPLPPFRVSMEPTTTVRFPGNQELARRFAAAAHLDAIVGNINSLVRHAPVGLVMLRGGPGLPVFIGDFSLDINQAAVP